MHHYTIIDQNELIVRGVVSVPMIIGWVTSLLVWGQTWDIGEWKAQLQKEAYIILEGACGVIETLSWVGLIALVLLPCWGLIPDGYGGWVVNPPVLYGRPPCWSKSRREQRRVRGWRSVRWHFHWGAAWDYARGRGRLLVWQVWLVMMLSAPASLRKSQDGISASWWAWGMLGLPVVRWLLVCSAVAWPYWGQSGLCRALRWGLYRLYQLGVLVLVVEGGAHLALATSTAASATFRIGLGGKLGGWLSGCETLPLAFGGLVQEAKGWRVRLEVTEDETHQVELVGPQGDRWWINYLPVDEFDRRIFLNFLRHIWTPEDTPKRPFLRQEWLAAGFDTFQELLSRWQRYHRAGDWRRLMSQRHGPLLSLDQIQQIVNVWTTNFWWTVTEVQAHLAHQGITCSPSEIQEAGRLSGFLLVRRRLRERFQKGAEGLKPKDEWLVGRLFGQIEMLLGKVEQGESLTSEEQLEINTLKSQRQALGLTSGRELEKALPWLFRVQQVLFGWWQEVEDDPIRCTYCGSTQVARKSRKPRYKKYYDEENNLQQVAVYRYYCKNSECKHQTFTNLPLGLLPHSPWPLNVHLLAVQGYAWGRSTYRLVGGALGVSSITAYRWVSAWGGELLPVAALFGVLRSSGVVGVDEKWVLVPKNNKPAGKHKKWMYVYLAVDVYTYDLLHIAIFPFLGKASARTFLLELRTKGYSPRVIVTDLNRDYSKPVTQVFPKAIHHECIFHALQWVQRQIKDVYGNDYAEMYPEALHLKETIYRIFQCKHKRTAQRRYELVMAMRKDYVISLPEAASIFATLERHWPKLVNAVGSKVIPKTNNAVELVIRRFDQHYQNFCGFDTIETAHHFLGVFELVYRFTPFALDNKKDRQRPPEQRIGGKCPLELAGYDVLKLPIAQVCRGLLLSWPLDSLEKVVPSA